GVPGPPKPPFGPSSPRPARVHLPAARFSGRRCQTPSVLPSVPEAGRRSRRKRPGPRGIPADVSNTFGRLPACLAPRRHLSDRAPLAQREPIAPRLGSPPRDHVPPPEREEDLVGRRPVLLLHRQPDPALRPAAHVPLPTLPLERLGHDPEQPPRRRLR